MKRIFEDYKKLKCIGCKKFFSGREPSGSGPSLCPDCLKSKELPLINDGDKIPENMGRDDWDEAENRYEAQEEKKSGGFLI